MRKILSDSAARKHSRILGIDPSTSKIALTLVVDGKPASTSSIDLGAGEAYDRVYRVRKYYPALIDLLQPEFVCIEQAIFVQNHDSSRKMAYVVGVIVAETKIKDIPIEDVHPATWKAFLGVKPVTASWKKDIINRMGDKDGRKEINRLRKCQTQQILRNTYDYFSWEDNDIADSCGIALYAYSRHGKEIDRHP